jgi:choline-sulfatase
MYGKMTFFEKSAKVPLIFEGDGIKPGTEKAAVSLVDVGPTIWALTGAEPLPETDGQSLALALEGGQLDPGRIVASELMESAYWGRELGYARMAFQNGMKFWTYHGHEDKDALFDLNEDPLEKANAIESHPEEAARLRDACGRMLGNPALMERIQSARRQHSKLFAAYDKAVGASHEEMWKDNPPSARGQMARSVTPPLDPEIIKKQMEGMIKK